MKTQGIYVYQKKRGDRRVWVAEIPDPRKGGRKTEVTVFRHESVAKKNQNAKRALKIATELLRQWRAEAGVTTPGVMPIRLADFLDHAGGDPGRPRRGGQLSPHTVERRVQILRKFGEWVTVQPVHRRGKDQQFGVGGLATEVSPDLILRYRRSLEKDELKPNSVQRELSVLHRAFEFGRELQLLALDHRNPVTRGWASRASVDRPVGSLDSRAGEIKS